MKRVYATTLSPKTIGALVQTLRKLIHDTEELGCTCADRSRGHQRNCSGMSYTQSARRLLRRIEKTA